MKALKVHPIIIFSHYEFVSIKASMINFDLKALLEMWLSKILDVWGSGRLSSDKVD